MADNTHIEWTEATWNPITGCTVHSPGCTNCYAMKLAGTRLAHHESRAGLTVETKAGPVWNGQVRFNEQWLDQPLRWKRPRMIFVCAHGDLFHESVADEWIDRVFAVMALCPQHTFQVLTKRSSRMREYIASRAGHGPTPGHHIMHAMDGITRAKWPDLRWPLPNVWLGVSVEDQARADERIPDLLATPAAVRWLSCEPLLGPVDLTAIPVLGASGDALPRKPLLQCTFREVNSVFEGTADVNPTLSALQVHEPLSDYDLGQNKLDWIVAGGESGPGARPMHPDWARSLRDQCAAAGVPFFFKQWGEWREVDGDDRFDTSKGRAGKPPAFIVKHDGSLHCFYNRLGDQAGHYSPVMIQVGRKRAGRLLDGQMHDGFPA